MSLSAGAKKEVVRRSPKQRRSQQTVEAVLIAAVKILKREGIAGVTTNRIAEAAGVSIGSVYQYFPDKRAIYAALHDRHVGDVRRVIEATLVEHASSSFEDLVRALVEAVVDVHASDPELHELLTTEVPNRGGAQAFEVHLRSVFKLAIAARAKTRPAPRDLDKMLFVLPLMIDGLSHGVATRRPPGLSLAAAREEVVRTVLTYLRSFEKTR